MPRGVVSGCFTSSFTAQFFCPAAVWIDTAGFTNLCAQV